MENTTTTEEFKNENLTIGMTRSPGCRVSLDISITPKASKAAYSKAVKKINKEVSLPGFRKGKAPEAIVIQKYGKYVDQEWKEILIQTSFQESLALCKVYPLNENSVKRPDVKKTSKEEDSHIVIEYEFSPEVPAVKPEEFSLDPVESKDVTDEDVETTLENIRLHHSDWEEVKDRAVEEGDYIDIDIDNLDEPSHPIAKNSRFKVAESKMGDWMRNLVLGLKPGETAEGTSEKSEEIADKDFIPTRCRITLNSIQKPSMPELDDALAKKVGVQTVEELKKRVKEDLERQEKQRVHEAKRRQIEEAMLEKYPFDIPASLVDAEKSSFIQQYGTPKQEEEEKIARDVDRALRMFFLARKITSDQKLNVSENELMQEVMQEVYSQPRSNADMNIEDMRSRAYIRLLSNKAKDFLISRVESA